MNQDAAEVVALQALGWLMSHEELGPVFIGASGASVEDIKARAGESAFLVSVLDFIVMDDAHVVEFCDSAGLSYDMPMQALHSMPGQAIPNWT